MATPYRVPSGYIDFTAIGRGRRDRQLEQQADEVYDFNRDQRQRDMELRQWDRQAADYLAPLLGNRQAAVDAGVSPIDFFVQQREQMLADPTYQSLDPQAQLRAVNQLQQSALVTAQQAQQRGDLGAANRLMEAFGVYPANTQVDLAAQSGDAGQIVQAIQQEYGSDLGFDPATNTVMIAGQRRPVVEALPNIYKARSVLGAYPAAGAALQTDTQLQQALRLAQDQRTREASVQRLQLLGQLAQTGDAAALRQLQELVGITPAAAPVAAPGAAAAGVVASPGAASAQLPLGALQGGTPAWLTALNASVQPGGLSTAAAVAPATSAAQSDAAGFSMLPLPGSLTPDSLREMGIDPASPQGQLLLAGDKSPGRSLLDGMNPVLSALPSAPAWLLPLVNALSAQALGGQAEQAPSLRQQEQDLLQQIADLRVRRSRARGRLYAADPTLSSVPGVSASDEQALIDALARVQGQLNGGANGSR